jgi:LmbE family N-acetylglucosaminyl deacetylase
VTPGAVLATLLWSIVHMNAVEMQHRLDRLLTVGRVMYVAAHPDDENTQLISYLTHGRSVRTAYLSITRGDGGQNLVGREQSPLLGVIRSHELMEARSLDGAEQLFTRARDFGYSKSAEETLAVWGHDAVLGEVVWAVRRFRPHVIVTRFPEQGETHGHHLASARLAREAFTAAADPARFPEQLERAGVWQAKRLVYNVPNRFMPQEARPDDLVVDIGGFDRASGLSYGEIAARSRSMHKSQGFGAARRFGPEPERFRHLEGEQATADLFDGIDLQWRHEAVRAALSAARAAFRSDRPAAAAPDLARALRALADVDDAGLRAWAEREIGTLLLAVSGLLLEARVDSAAVVPGASLPVKVLALRRSDVPVRWRSLRLGGDPVAVELDLAEHAPVERSVEHRVPAGAGVSLVPWLHHLPDQGRDRGEGDPDVPLPEPAVVAELELEIAGALVRARVPVRHHRVDPVEGERARDVEVLPPITVTPAARAVLVPCPSRCAAELRVSVRVRRPGKLRMDLPAGYRVLGLDPEPKSDQELTLRVEADPGAAPGALRFVAEVDGRSWSLAEHAIDHRHLPPRTVLLPSDVTLTTAPLTVAEGLVGHVAGPGDDVADGLRRAGFRVADIDDDELAHGDLDRFGSILVGIRAFNTRDALRRHAARLFAYAERGGTVVVQYATHTQREPLGVEIFPHEVRIGRGRVTDEKAEVTMLDPEHPLLATPHRIEPADFGGWVQERGLYFAEKWDEAHVAPLLALADAGEEPQRGALLVSDHGKGRLVYTGLALFRQVPAGVPGAYRLLANLLARRDAKAGADEPPPVLGSWNKLYAVVLVLLAVLIGSFYLLSRRYRS